nr:MAG TPA: hypothetical protein [Microviridae sp.]
MENKKTPASNTVFLVSVKSKTSNDKGEIYVVSSSFLNAFIESHLTSDVVLLIDTIDTYGLTF